MEKLPPIEKIHEAYSAIADHRVTLLDNFALIKSSDETKEYTVTWGENLYTSNDNGSFWQGYAGYPMIAVLMLQDRLPLDKTIAGYFRGINWKALNTKHKAKYSKAVAEVMETLKKQNVDCEAINAEVNRVYENIKILDVVTQRSRIKPIRLAAK